MTRRFPIVLGVSLLALAGAQALRIARTNPPISADVPAPAEVKAVLRRVCYDCHSNETIWPWYSRVAPASWLAGHDVEEGREELNFSTWDAYAGPRRAKKLRATATEVEEGTMPPWYYVFVHPEARLGERERATLLEWARAGAAASPGGE